MSSAHRLTALAVLTIALSGTVFADSISLNLTSLSMSTVPGGSVTFDGSITNNTGFSLSSADLFLNFFNFDPGSINPTQLLGSVDFTIDNGATSGVVDLFSVMVADGVPLGSTLPMDLTLEDINNNTSGPITVETSTGHVSAVPEPGTLSLCLMGATLLTRFIAGTRQKRRPASG
jgi:hypothetical protein